MRVYFVNSSSNSDSAAASLRRQQRKAAHNNTQPTLLHGHYTGITYITEHTSGYVQHHTEIHLVRSFKEIRDWFAHLVTVFTASSDKGGRCALWLSARHWPPYGTGVIVCILTWKGIQYTWGIVCSGDTVLRYISSIWNIQIHNTGMCTATYVIDRSRSSIDQASNICLYYW